VLGVHGPGDVWAPLAGDPFAAACTSAPLDDLLRWADVVIAYQAVPETLGRVRSSSRPVVVDVDDPGAEIRFGLGRVAQARNAIGRVRRRRSPLAPLRARRAATRLPVLVANPSLLDLYPGAVVVPHVRVPRPHVPLPDGPPRVAFVGTVRPGKGLDLLRGSAERVGIELVVTADPPPDARDTERWLGVTSMAAGLDVIDQVHACAVLSDPTSWRRYQLPVKLIDGMLAGRVVIGTRTAPIEWALGGAGITVERTDAAVDAALGALVEGTRRAEIGARARRRALDLFTPAAVADVVAQTLVAATRS
jgi:glycosyltransferase involved in cell wall biosynthesis